MAAALFPHGLVVPAFLIGAGICLFTAVQAAVVGLHGHRVPIYLTFSLTCLCAAGYLYCTGLYYSADSVPAAATALRGQLNCGFVFLPAFAWFTALYSGQGRVGPWPKVVAALSIAFVIANQFSPYSLRFAALQVAEPLRMPWGEMLPRFAGRFSGWGLAVHATAWSVFAWAAWRARVMFAHGRRRAGLLFGVYTLLQLLMAVTGALIDLGYVRWIYTGGFAFFGMPLIMGLCLALDLRQQNAAFEAATSALSDELDKRREAEAEARQQSDERQRLEAELQQAQRLQAIGMLAGGVAHDFNNILTVMLGQADAGMASPSSSLGARERFLEIRKAALKGSDLTGQLLSLGRRRVLHKRSLDVSVAIRELQPMLERLVGGAITLRFDLDPVPATVLADASQIDQVLLNLGVNARDAMPEGGTLTFATRHVSHDPRATGVIAEENLRPYVQLTVTDTGVGMDEATRARIFEPFFTTKAVDRGTGLGLAVVHGIVTQHEGQIRVRSEPEMGSAFEILLPFAESTVVESQTRAVPRRGTGGATILLVEDNDMVRTVTQEILQGLGYSVWPAVDADEASNLFREHRDQIDLLITDVVMGRLSGPEIAAAMWAERPDLPVLFVTGYDAGHNLRALGSSPSQAVTAVLLKPFTRDAVEQKVRELLDAAIRVPHPPI